MTRCVCGRWSSDTLAIYVLTLAASFALGFVQEMLASFNGNAAERCVLLPPCPFP